MDRCEWCGKIDYPSRVRARIAIAHLRKREGVMSLRVYECQYGGNWHIGNSGNYGVKRKKRKKRKPPRKRQRGATHPRYPK